MSGNRPSPRGSRPRATARPGSRPGPRPPGPRPRGQASAGGPGGSGHTGPPPRPRFTGRAAILVLVLAVLVVSYASSMRAYLEQRHHIESLEQSIAQSQAHIEQMKRERERWQDPAYVRAKARERFGWVLPGQIGFQIIDENGKPLGHDDALSDPETTVEEDRPLWWQSAWASVEAAGHPEKHLERPTPAESIRPPKSKKR